ncbi:hypothetical protein F4776DRAFT_145846 [Hypoxylon sp. NC0597]|nr:hypothetical protein F4776DRAFT_145846 [Hypoxylon sp. NC0597]
MLRRFCIVRPSIRGRRIGSDGRMVGRITVTIAYSYIVYLGRLNRLLFNIYGVPFASYLQIYYIGLFIVSWEKFVIMPCRYLW